MEDLFIDNEIKNLKVIFKKEGIKGEIELERLERYPLVLAHIKKRRIILNRDF